LSLTIDSLKKQHKELMEAAVREAIKSEAGKLNVLQAEALK
jgi:hypothetical protein